MTDRAQFEAMLEALINEDQETAQEIFHNIVVGKSREIYEELLESDFSKDQGNPYGKADDGMEEEEEEEEEEEGYEPKEDDAEEDDSEEDGEEDDSEEEPAFGDEEGEEDGEEGEGDMEDRVMDLEDALEDLKAEFEQLLAGEEHEEEQEPGIHGAGMPMHDIEAGMHDEEEAEGMPMMEYVNKVPSPKHGDNGVNNKSTLDGSITNNMGGTSANIVAGHREVSADVGAKSKVTGTGVFKGEPKLQNGGNINVPGGKAGKTAFKTQVKGGGIDRQAGFNKPGQNIGAGTGKNETTGEKNTQSTLRPIKK